MDDTLDRNAVMEQIKDDYDERIMAKLEQIRQDALATGWTAGPSYRMHDDDYRWSFACWPTAERDSNDAGTIDCTIEIGEASGYGDDDQPFGMSFRLDVVEYGGVILGQFAPYNYTPEVWVDGRDAAAVEERWLHIEQGTTAFVADLLANAHQRDCEHCTRSEDRCSDESDRNCFRPA